MSYEDLLSLMKERRAQMKAEFDLMLKNFSSKDENLRTSYIHRMHEIDLLLDAVNGKDALRKLMMSIPNRRD